MCSKSELEDAQCAGRQNGLAHMALQHKECPMAPYAEVLKMPLAHVLVALTESKDGG